MHVLHLIRVIASSHEEAELFAESAKYGYGDEDNWSCVCGSMKEDGTTHSTGEGRFDPEEYTLSTIKELTINWCKGNKYNEEKFYQLADIILSYKPIKDNFLWYYAQKYCEHRYNLGDLDWKTFDAWSQEFRSDEFDENGVTYFEPSTNENVSLEKYLVFIDTHT